MKVFEYCIIYLPKAVGNGKAEPSKILVQPTTVLAVDQTKASMIASRAIPENYIDKLEEIEVAVRPF